MLAAILVLRQKLYKRLVYRLALYQVLSALVMGFVFVMQVMFINYDDSPNIHVCTVFGFLVLYTEWMKLLALHDVGDLSSLLFCSTSQEYEEA